MSAPKTIEEEYLRSAELALVNAVRGGKGSSGFELRLQVLEAASARFGGFGLEEYHLSFGVKSKRPVAELIELAAPVVDAIENSPLHHALALSALAREVLDECDRKSTGAYHTDFRLANRLAELAAPTLTHGSKVIDPASGAGMLLAALTYAVCGRDRAKVARWLENGVYAADLSANSLRATLLSLASFTDDLNALRTMRSHWFCGDSLLAKREVWTNMSPDGFDAVIGNPPWEKVKLSRHEFLKNMGAKRHYGAQVKDLDQSHFSTERKKLSGYSRGLLERYPTLGNGEPDLYIAFTDLFFELCKEQGVVVALVPGGFIRSQGTQAIRRKIFDACQSVSLSIIDNRARFFSIDTRFKFLAISLVKSSPEATKREPIRLSHERGTPTGLKVDGVARIGRSKLGAVRPDLSLPEVRSSAEWRLYTKIAKTGISWSEPRYGWSPKFCREVDMTKERSKFLSKAISGALPLVEGRMVQAHRLGVKGYVSGTGRKALWKAYPIGGSRITPQFWIRLSDIPKSNQNRVGQPRVGFCDIAGQTNERSLMASLIPPGVACGNKVPTIVFPEDPSEERLLVWAAIANSFVFDWVLRRILTTTVNYFLLQSVWLPKLTKSGLPWKKLARSARELQSLNNVSSKLEACKRVAQLRSEIDAEVAIAYGLELQDMELVLEDFPLLDRRQSALPGESKSTITRDTVLAALVKRVGYGPSVWSQRAIEASRLGALAYVPSELDMNGERTSKRGAQCDV